MFQSVLTCFVKPGETAKVIFFVGTPRPGVCAADCHHHLPDSKQFLFEDHDALCPMCFRVMPKSIRGMIDRNSPYGQGEIEARYALRGPSPNGEVSNTLDEAGGLSGIEIFLPVDLVWLVLPGHPQTMSEDAAQVNDLEGADESWRNDATGYFV